LLLFYSKVILEIDGNNSIYYIYNEVEDLIGFKYNNEVYYYIKNGQNDIIGILDNNYNKIVEYIYDSWGNILEIKDNSNNNIGIINPFRYRSYYYDNETKLYYLNSRYYNPLWGRFLNADRELINDNTLGCNLYIYCYNSPNVLTDYSGNRPGDLFLSVDEAARDFALIYNSLSIKNNVEYASNIYLVKKIVGIEATPIKFLGILLGHKYKIITKSYYTYTVASKGTRKSSVPSPIPKKTTLSGIVHTHSRYNGGSDVNDFSDADEWQAFYKKVPVYVATPNGSLKKYEKGYKKSITLFNDIPNDPNDPTSPK